VLVPNHWQAAQINIIETHFQVMLSGVGYREGHFCSAPLMLISTIPAIDSTDGGREAVVDLRRILLLTQSSPRIPLHDYRTVPVQPGTLHTEQA
jgi:hypothetical protein